MVLDVIKHTLSPEILGKASLRGNEYAWPPESVEAAINDARHHGLETIGGGGTIPAAGLDLRAVLDRL
jgi:hypothetical protein